MTSPTKGSSGKSPGGSNKGAVSPPKQLQQQGASSPAKQAAPRANKISKEKKATKYDLGTPSRLSVQAPVVGPDGAMLVRSTKPEKPKLEKDERKMLDLILSGNENVIFRTHTV